MADRAKELSAMRDGAAAEAGLAGRSVAAAEERAQAAEELAAELRTAAIESETELLAVRDDAANAAAAADQR